MSLISLALLISSAASASGPRYVTGPPFFTGKPGVPIGWKQTTLLYSTDPGDLSLFVNHRAADALVAAAAGVWNVHVASISVGQGSGLAEHVSGQNVALSSGGLLWPADVASANYEAIPVAVVYDTDGSVTDTLLGAGASAPEECAQNAVLESVDRFDPAGYILHAIIVVNGRCTGSAPEQQLQLQYQLERVFGRVLGLAWSQTNDNVYTGTPTPTYDQAEHWPIMHPLDLLCGAYSFQCLPDPFTLRPDDVAGLVGIYPLAAGASLGQANAVQGSVTFPSGEGMAGVNVLVRRTPRFSPIAQDWFETSAVTGSSFRRNDHSPFVSPANTAQASFGSPSTQNQGFFFIPYFAVVDPFEAQGEIVSTEPLNPLYIGEASVGPYAPGIVSPAGSAPLPYSTVSGPGTTVSTGFSIPDAPAACGDGLDGSPELPMVLPASGWWNGLLCGYGHVSYSAALIRGGRSFTVEVTALDAASLATTTKAMPVIGLFAPTDAAGSLPSLGAATAAFNSLMVGTTTLDASPFPPGNAATEVRIGIADQRGDGRPDFPYQARLFYADHLSPEVVDPAGGTFTITGTGFRTGNSVTINGVAAAVTSWTATTLLVAAPAAGVAGAALGVPVDVVVRDGGTDASSFMTAALTYATVNSFAETMKLVSAQAAATFVGEATPVPFAVQVLQGDGLTPVAGAAVVFTASPANSVHFASSGAATCIVTTDANGIASTSVFPQVAATITMQATLGALSFSAEFDAVTRPAAMKLITAPAASQLVGVPAKTAFMVQLVTTNGTGIAGQLVTFQVTSGSAAFSPCNASPCSILSNKYGQALVAVTPTATGPVTLQASDGTLSQTASFTALPNTPSLKLLTAPNPAAYVNESGGVFKVQLLQADGVSGAAQAPVVFTGPPGTTWTVCGFHVCTIATDRNGEAASSLVTSVHGTIQLVASYGDQSVSATSVVSVRSPKLSLVSAPSGSVDVGSAAPTPFVVQLLDGFGKPMAGQQINYGGVQGSVKMDCGLGSCVGLTGATGETGGTATPLQPGTILLTATWLDQSVTASFTSVGTPEALNPVVVPPPSVHAGDKLSFQYQLIGTSGTPLKGRSVYFSVPVGVLAFDGCAYATCGTKTDTNGIASATATAFTLGLVAVQATVDGLTGQASFTVLPGPSNVSIVSGANQFVTGGAPFQPVVIQVTDAAGTPIPSAPVRVGQTVRALVPCPPQGRCPAAPTLASSNAVLTTDPRGTVSVQPMVIVGTATTTALSFSFGAQGFATTEVSSTP